MGNTKKPADAIMFVPDMDSDVGDITVKHGESYAEHIQKTVHDVDYSKSPTRQFREALRTGKTMVDFEGKMTEVTISGVDFHIFDAKTGIKFTENLSIAQSRKVMFEGKDVAVFSPKFREAQQKHADHLAFVEHMSANKTVDQTKDRIREDVLLNAPLSDNPNIAGGAMDTEFTPIGNGPMNQQLYLHDQWSMLAKAFEAYHHNPYAKRAIDIIVNFVLGRGFSISFHDEVLQTNWDANMYDLRFYETIYTLLRDLERQGELFLRPVFDRFTGRMTDLLNIEASTILQVMHDPENVNKILGYYQQYMTPIQVYGPEALKARYVVRIYSPDEIIHVKINNTGAEVRGRSTLMPAFEYLKMVRDYHIASANKAIASACLIFDWAVEGTSSDVTSFANSMPPVNYKNPIASVYHSAKAKLTAVSTSEARGRDTALEQLVNAIAVATGVGKEYLGASLSSSRTSSLVGTEPATKHFEQRQVVLSVGIFEPLISKWIDAQISAGQVSETRLSTSQDKLKNAVHATKTGDYGKAISHLYSILNGKQVEVDLDRTVSVTFPEIVKGDITQTLQNIGFMQAMGWWSPERAAARATSEWGNIKNYDYMDEQQSIKTIGIKPIAASQQQAIMVDEEHPPVTAGGFGKQPSPAPTTSANDDTHANTRNNVAGAGASAIRGALGRGAKESGITRTLFGRKK